VFRSSCIFLIKLICSLCFTISIAEAGYAQAGKWTWMKGDTAFYGWLHKGTLGVEDSTVHPPSLYLGSSWTDDSGTLWLFGGLTYAMLSYDIDYFDMIWRYNPATNNWACIKASSYANSLGEYGAPGLGDSSTYPPGRTVSALWKDTSGTIWMFGGVSVWGAWNDLWKYDMNTNIWTWVNGPDWYNIPGTYGTKGVPSSTNNPPPRGQSASWVDAENNLWLFGGWWLNPSVGWEFYNDLWKYNTSTNQWAWMGGTNQPDQPGIYGTQGIPDTSNLPTGRSCNCSWTDTAGNFYLFGGSSLDPLWLVYADIWRYNPNTKEWTWLKGPSNSNTDGIVGNYCEYEEPNNPETRDEAPCLRMNDDEVLLFGGENRGTTASATTRDVWVYKISTNTWKRVWGDNLPYEGNYGSKGIYASSNDPRSRIGATAWRQNENSLWIYGGNWCVFSCP
jgi:N-acetylneuraminic acid mutarotase